MLIQHTSSQELAQFGHGLFTFGLLYGLKDPETDQNHNQMIDLKEWFDRSNQIVQQHRIANLGEQTPQMIAAPSVRLIPISIAPGATK